MLSELVAAIDPVDELEEEHRAQTLAWLSQTEDVYRRIKPATPEKHLVSYVVPMAGDDVLLVAHRNAGLWLPPGGHVEPGEDPADTAARELEEELGVTGARSAPSFITINRTVGADAPHTDVSLWFVADVPRNAVLTPDAGEFTEVRWWTRVELADADPAGFDRHLFRFLAKHLA